MEPWRNFSSLCCFCAYALTVFQVSWVLIASLAFSGSFLSSKEGLTTILNESNFNINKNMECKQNVRNTLKLPRINTCSCSTPQINHIQGLFRAALTRFLSVFISANIPLPKNHNSNFKLIFQRNTYCLIVFLL